VITKSLNSFLMIWLVGGLSTAVQGQMIVEEASARADVKLRGESVYRHNKSGHLSLSRSYSYQDKYDRGTVSGQFSMHTSPSGIFFSGEGKAHGTANCHAYYGGALGVNFRVEQMSIYKLKHRWTVDGETPYFVISSNFNMFQLNSSGRGTVVGCLQPGQHSIGVRTEAGVRNNTPKGGSLQLKFSVRSLGIDGSGFANVSIGVPVYGQADSRWANLPLGSPDNKNNIKKKGCVLASAAMIMGAMLPGQLFTPKQLNDFVLNSNNDVTWSRVASFMSDWDPNRNYRAQRKGLHGSAAKNLVKKIEIAEVMAKYKVPVAVRRGGHTMVAYAVTGDVCDPNIMVADPGKGLQGVTRMLEESEYSSISHIDYIIPSGTGPTLWGNIMCPAELMISDAQGRRTGYDPNTETEYSEIPGVYYHVNTPNYDYGDANNAVEYDRSELTKTAVVYGHAGENLLFEVLGDGYGDGHFTVEAAGSDGNISMMHDETYPLEPNSVDYVVVETPRAGDFDLDGDVDWVDMGVLLDNWLGEGEGLSGDVFPPGQDEWVDFYDLAAFTELLYGAEN